MYEGGSSSNDKMQLEEEAIKTLLHISCQNEEKLGLNEIVQVDEHTKKRFNSNKIHVDNVFGPWQPCHFEHDREVALNSELKKDQRKNNLKTRENVSNHKSTSRSLNRLKNSKIPHGISNAQHQTGENFPFCHFEDSREYITQYRENITFSTMLDYRKNLMKTSTTNLCKKCESSVGSCDIMKICHCTGNSPASSSVCYADPGTFSRHRFLYGGIDQNKKVKSPGGGKLWISGSVKHSPPHCIKSISKSAKSKQDFKKKNRYNVRIKTGNDSPETLRVFTSPKGLFGPRMGSNRPPVNDASEIRCGTPTSQLISCLRPKIPQAAIPSRSTSFQACIMPMNVSNVKHSKTP